MRNSPSRTCLFKDDVSKSNPRLVLRGKLDSIAALSSYICNASYRLIDLKIKTAIAQGIIGEIAVLRENIGTLQTYEATCLAHLIENLLYDARFHKYEECARLDEGWVDPTSELGTLVNILRTQIREAELIVWKLNSDDFDETLYNIGIILNMLSSKCMGIMKKTEEYFNNGD